MIVENITNIESLEMQFPGAKHAFKQVLVGPEQGWTGYVMRLMTLKDKGNSPKHTHPWPHINFITKGKGMLHMAGKDYEITAGSFAFVPPNVEHQYINSCEKDFEFICIVPEEGEK